MNRLAAVMIFALVAGLTNIADACHRCKRSSCTSPCVSTCAPVCQTVCRTSYITVVKCCPVTYCKKVRYIDCCGCCRTKIVRCTKYVKRCVRVPVTTYTTICCAPASTVCCEPEPCCDSGRHGLFGRLHALCRR